MVPSGAGSTAVTAAPFIPARNSPQSRVVLGARSTDDRAPLVREIGAHALACDATRRAVVEKLFADLDAAGHTPEIVIYNASYRARGPLVELDPADVEKSLAVTAFGAF